MTSTTPEAGWYQDSSTPGLARWWDGSQWTEHTAPLDGPEPPPPAGMPSEPDAAAPEPEAPTAKPAPGTFEPEPESFTPEGDPSPGPEVSDTTTPPAGVSTGSWVAAPSAPTPGRSGASGSRRFLVVLLLLVVVAAIAVGAWYWMSSLATDVEDAGAQMTGAVDDAGDTAARSDVQQLQTALTVYLSADGSGELPTITSDGSAYLIEGASGDTTSVGMSEGVAFGGFSGTDGSDWCVWVTASSGVSYQGEPGTTPSEGRCG
ncbi:DUF2510 domain-containing protein [Demequina salsinemoris]|uniref:DUF2510 domain-containing protein n=1 Tax=Demequina salsinemoris TaxID=577470 RepID=UPI0007803F42|nr:DUF2510 domain-containing protein [Demequina salsinemoris]